MRKVLRHSGRVFIGLVVLGLGVYGWASSKAARIYGSPVEVHDVEFPIPFSLDENELAPVGPDPVAVGSLDTLRAIDRGRHLVESRYACADCHGEDFSGGVMIDVPLIGRGFGPNLTGGRGSVTSAYGAADWDRIVRHGVGLDGTPTAMPSESFQHMSDQELSDIVTYLGSVPPVDNEVPPMSMGPVGKLLVAAGKITPAYFRIAAHDGPHAAAPPAEEPSVDFGRHLAATRLRTPMAEVVTYTAGMSDIEIGALWAYLRSLPPLQDDE